jgi:hypothetical protein
MSSIRLQRSTAGIIFEAMVPWPGACGEGRWDRSSDMRAIRGNVFCNRLRDPMAGWEGVAWPESAAGDERAGRASIEDDTNIRNGA